MSVRAQGEATGPDVDEAFRDFIAGLVKEEVEANKLEKIRIEKQGLSIKPPPRRGFGGRSGV